MAAEPQLKVLYIKESIIAEQEWPVAVPLHVLNVKGLSLRDITTRRDVVDKRMLSSNIMALSRQDRCWGSPRTRSPVSDPSRESPQPDPSGQNLSSNPTLEYNITMKIKGWKLTWAIFKPRLGHWKFTETESKRGRWRQPTPPHQPRWLIPPADSCSQGKDWIWRGSTEN
jgi:hypothetical protein